jgi:hypothetical protein
MFKTAVKFDWDKDLPRAPNYTSGKDIYKKSQQNFRDRLKHKETVSTTKIDLSPYLQQSP